jgi:hypothetical protein
VLNVSGPCDLLEKSFAVFGRRPSDRSRTSHAIRCVPDNYEGEADPEG